MGLRSDRNALLPQTAAARGDYGPKVKKQASLAQGMLAAGRRTAAANKKGTGRGKAR